MDPILGPLEQFWLTIAGYLPNIIGAAIVLLIGWLIAIGLGAGESQAGTLFQSRKADAGNRSQFRHGENGLWL